MRSQGSMGQWPLQIFTIIDPTVIYPCFYQRNDRADSCYCRNEKVTPNPFFHKFLTPGPDPSPKEKRRILPESTPVIQIRSHLCCLVDISVATSDVSTSHLMFTEKFPMFDVLATNLMFTRLLLLFSIFSLILGLK